MRRGDQVEITAQVTGQGGRIYLPGARVIVGREFDADQAGALIAKGKARLAPPPPTPPTPAETPAGLLNLAELQEELGRRVGGAPLQAWTTDDLLAELERRGALQHEEDPFEVVQIDLPTLGAVQAREGRFEAVRQDLRLVGVTGNSWAQLAEAYAAWLLSRASAAPPSPPQEA